MPTYNTAGNEFSQNVKVQLVAGAIADNLDYVRASVSKLSESDMRNKKFGKSYKLYIADPGTVQEGLQAKPDDIVERETEITLNNFNTSVAIDAWQDLTNIEDFTKEIAKPKGQLLARTLQKRVVKDNVFKNMQAVVGTAGFGILSDAASALDELAVGGDIVSFMPPTVMGKIAASGLANFIPAQNAKEIYSQNYLGEYAGASQVQLAVLPSIKTPANASTATITLVPVTDDQSNVIGFEPVDTIAGTDLFPGAIFKASGLKIVDQSGIETEQDVVISVLSTNAAGTSAKINPLYISIEGKGFGNPNAWVPVGTTTLTLTALLDASTDYWVGQVRTRDTSLAFDNYKFSSLPGSENEDVATVGGISVKMSMYGEGDCLEKLIRLDVPHAAGIYEPRSCVGVYIKKA